MINLLLGIIIGGALVYYLTDIFHQEDNETNEFIIEALEDTVFDLESRLNVSQTNHINDLSQVLSTVYYDAETNKPFTLGDEEIVELGQL